MKKLIIISAFLLASLVACTFEESPSINVFENLMLQESDMSKGMNWSAANSSCENSSIGGYEDWHLPNLAELGVMYNNKSLIDGIGYSDDYWSSERYRNYYYYYYDFYDGTARYDSSSKSFAVRCVRTIVNDTNSSNIVFETKLIIKNESSYDIDSAVWNNVSFGTIKRGYSSEKTVSAGSGYVFFTKTVDDLELRTDAVIVVEPETSGELIIQNNTLVLEIANSANKRTLSTIEATPPVFGNLMLQGKDLSKSANWSSANAMCEDSEITGYSDWRLPTRAELGVIYNNRESISGISYSYYDNFVSYWSSELYPSTSSYYYYNMSSGVIGYSSNSNAVRCVRSVN